MKYVKIMNVALAIALLMVGYVFAAEQTICPVLGGKIDKELYADHEGKRIYFCCESCLDDFRKDPAKYVKKLEDEGVTLDKAPKSENKKGAHGDHMKKKKGPHENHMKDM